MCYCLIAVIYASIAIIMVPVYGSSEKGWLFYATTQLLSVEPGSYLLAQFTGCFIMLLLILEYSFVYRYFVMCSKSQLEWFQESKRIIIITIFYFSIFAVTMVPVYTYMRLNPEIAESFANDKNSSFQLNLYNISYVGAPMFTKDGKIHFKMAMIVIIWTIVMLSSCYVFSYCIFKIMRAFRDTVGFQMSLTQRKLQTRLFLLLLFQTLAPVCFTFFPGFLSYVFGYLRYYESHISRGTAAILPVAQVIDPFLIFYMITDYRNYVVYVIKKYICCQTNITIRTTSLNRASEDGPAALSVSAANGQA